MTWSPRAFSCRLLVAVAGALLLAGCPASDPPGLEEVVWGQDAILDADAVRDGDAGLDAEVPKDADASLDAEVRKDVPADLPTDLPADLPADVATACTPGEVACLRDGYTTCRADGSGWGPVKSCPDGTTCRDGACRKAEGLTCGQTVDCMLARSVPPAMSSQGCLAMASAEGAATFESLMACAEEVCGPVEDWAGYGCAMLQAFQDACLDLYRACTGCLPSCEGKECGDDGCGGSCGGCEAGLGCDPSSGRCVPTPAGDGCAATDVPGCGGCACEAYVCKRDPYCCKTGWDGMCARECANGGFCG